MAPSRPKPKHRCHAPGCPTRIPESVLMCRDHWNMLPKDMTRQLVDLHPVGQPWRLDRADDCAQLAQACIAHLRARQAEPGRGVW